ncbi:MAG: hypothetical protein ABSF24_02945 [Candidatus Bathyarchaeia archaeon]
MSRGGWEKYLPQKVKVGVSGRYSPVYGSVEWSLTSGRRRRRR